MKPLGDAFIRLITMIIAVVIFCTVVSGIAGMEDMKKVGRVGGKALLYFEVVSTLALIIGLIVANVLHPGSSFNINPATLDAKAVAGYAGQAKAQTVTDFHPAYHPRHSGGCLCQRRYSAGFAGRGPVRLCAVNGRTPLQAARRSVQRAHSRGIRGREYRYAPGPDRRFRRHGIYRRQIWHRFARTVGQLILLFYATCILFVVIVLGPIAYFAGFNIFKFLLYIKEEILLVLTVSSSEPALPTLMEKMERLGCSQALVGLVVPTGYTFNTDGSSLYMTLAALFHCSGHAYLS